MRTTIDYGIDLGTSNSCVAAIDGIEAVVLKNNQQSETTPSFVWVKDDGKTIMVGKQALDTMKRSDGLDIFSRFKRNMGETVEYRAKNSGRAFTAVELSAEVLKELKKTVRERKQEDITAAVVTVPAKFGLAQTRATHEAAKLAGFDRIELVQEPAAAALAYGFQRNEGKSFHLVYDMGAGTFDAALLRINDGLIEIINQGGDNQLGGTNIDSEIAEKILIPFIQKEYGIRDFERGNPKYATDYGKLLLAIEDAKIELSSNDTALVSVDRLFKASSAGPVFLDFELSRSQILPLIEPFVRRSINLCEKVIREANLASGDVESILLVGGPTHTPQLREMLNEIGIKINYNIDPMTVVAQGAAIFASTQILTKKQTKGVQGTVKYRLEADYQTTGMDEEVILGGKVSSPNGKAVDGLSIAFIEKKSKWKSGSIAIKTNGAFMTTLKADRGRRNEFQVELTDAQGRLLEIEPDVIPYTVGASISKTILSNTLGIGVESGDMIQIVKKGSSLPTKGSHTSLQSTKLVRRGQAGDVFVIPLYEGESPKVTSNQEVGAIRFDGTQIKRDLPENQKVEVEIVVDSSLQVVAKAYIPFLDEEFEAIIDLKNHTEKIEVMVEQINTVLTRLEKIRGQAEEYDNSDVLNRIRTLEVEENLIDRLQRASKASQKGDSEALRETANLIRSLKCTVEELEAILELPKLEEEAAEKLERVEELVDEAGNGKERRDFRRVKQELEDALNKRNAKAVKEKMEELDKINYPILMRQPLWWVGYLEYLAESEQRSVMQDQRKANQLFQKGKEAIERKDVEQIRSVVFQLIDLMPEKDRAKASGYQSTVRQ